MKTYGVWDVSNKKFWCTHHNKYIWNTTGAAKNAWLNSRSYKDRPDKFDDQQDFIVVECSIIPTEEYKQLLGECKDE